jgi:phosphocarrier protein HPr
MTLNNQDSTLLRLERKVKVKNELGIHTRPATAIVKMLQGVKCNVWFTYKTDRINAKSILSILMLAARRNGQITIEVEGEDAEQTMKLLVEGFETRFGEGF